MSDDTDFLQCQFTTQRLNLFHIDQAASHAIGKNEIENAAVTILTPTVVRSLPPYFSNIDNKEQARLWLKKVTSETNLLIIQNCSNRQVIGFIFLHPDKDDIVNLGYLLQKLGFVKNLELSNDVTDYYEYQFISD